MNLQRIASAATISLALVVTASPARAADGTDWAGGNSAWLADGPDWAGGNSGIASYLGREFARLQRTAGTSNLPDPRRAGSWDHDSRIPAPPAVQRTYSWNHDSHIPAPPAVRHAYSWDHDSHIGR